MVDKKTTDKKPAAKAAASKSTASGGAKKASADSTKSSAAKKTTAGAVKPKVAESRPTDPKASSKAASKASLKSSTAATAKAGALKESDMKAAAQKISALDKKNADDAIKSKKGVDDLKSRAHEAKQLAQKKILEKAYVSDKPTDPLERLANTFDSSARRWEMVVYPSLFAFVLLAGYGFFLIYRLTHDIATLSQSVTHMAVIVSDAMPRMTKDLNVMTSSMDSMTGNISNMSGDIGGMTTEITSMSGQMNSLTPMSHNIRSMTHNIGNMNRSVYGMQRDMHGMNRTVSSGPFGMMNDVMPFNSSTNVPPAMAPQQTWPSYNPTPQQNYVLRRPPAAPAGTAKKQATQRSTKPAATVKPVSTQKNVKTEVTMPGTSPVILKNTPVNSVPVRDRSTGHMWNSK